MTSELEHDAGYRAYAALRDSIQQYFDLGLETEDVAAEIEAAFVDHVAGREKDLEEAHTVAFDDMTYAIEQFLELGFSLPRLNQAFTDAVECVLDGDSELENEETELVA